MTDNSKQSQVSAILRYLRAGESITAIDALNMFGSWNLKGRIWDIKNRLEETETVERVWIKTQSGKRVAQYRIKAVEPPAATLCSKIP